MVENRGKNTSTTISYHFWSKLASSFEAFTVSSAPNKNAAYETSISLNDGPSKTFKARDEAIGHLRSLLSSCPPGCKDLVTTHWSLAEETVKL